MKKLLIMLLISICAIAWRSDEILHGLGMAQVAADPTPSLQNLTVPADQHTHKAMTITEFQELSKTDPQAYQKFIDSLQVPQERSEADKLMNFFARGKYE